MKAENREGRPQRDSAEREEYAGARSADGRELTEADGADLLERILDRNNLNRAYKQVRANHGAPEIDGMTVEDALGYFGIASMKNTLKSWDEWLRRRFRMYIWKQWKNPKTRVKALLKLGVPLERAYVAARTRKGYWAASAIPCVHEGLSKEVLARAGYYSIQERYEHLHLCG